MFCDHCSAYVSNKRNECPQCGKHLGIPETESQATYEAPYPQTYYCEKCKGTIYTQLCPSHNIPGVLVSDISARFIEDWPEEAEKAAISPGLGKDRRLPGGSERILKAPKATRKNKQPVSQERPSKNHFQESPVFQYSPPEIGEKPDFGSVYVENAADFQQTDRVVTSAKVKRKRSDFFPALMLIILGGTLFAAGWYFYNIYVPVNNRSEYFSRTEKLLENGKFQEALATYAELKKQLPNDPNLVEIESKIEALQARLADFQGTIQELRTQAEKAFQEKRYVGAGENNAAAYLTKLLSLAPNDQSALNLMDKIVATLKTDATNALNRENYQEAITCYRRILKIRPNNVYALNELARIQRLLTKNEDEDQLLTTDQLKYSKADSIDKPAEFTSGEKFGDMNAHQDSSQVATSLAANLQSKVEASLVIEALLDGGGKRVHIHREIPKTPADIVLEKLVTVRAKCIVGTDGIIEHIKLASPAEEPALNQLAMAALRDYRYEPATYLGKPVRFKCTEILVFK